MSCGKRKLPTELDAKLALLSIDKKIKHHYKTNLDSRAECRYYFCDSCSAYHLTKQKEAK